MKLQVDVRTLFATAPAEAPAFDGVLDLRRLPWADGSFAAIELDDVPEPEAWTVSGPALNECRRILKRHGLLEIRTRPMDAARAQATERGTMRALTRLLQNHGFEVVAIDPVDGGLISAMALRADGPEDVFADQVSAIAAHVTMHGPLLDGSDDAAAGRALAAELDADGTRVRVRVIFDVLDALYCD